MPHIHTVPGQRDMTVSAYIVRHDANGTWVCLVHMHKKIDMLMQVGGHIELDETPWQAVAHELSDESGYELSELKLLQPSTEVLAMHASIVHPVPLLQNTHYVGDQHYHSDQCYGFVADSLPAKLPSDQESTDLRWLTIAELKAGVESGTVLSDVVAIYEFILSHIKHYARINPLQFSLKKPTEGIRYKR